MRTTPPYVFLTQQSEFSTTCYTYMPLAYPTTAHLKVICLHVTMDNLPDIPTAEHANAALIEAKHKAACNLPLILERIAERAFDPTSNFKQLMDSGEFMYKVSGMAAKQAEKALGTGFSITIQLAGDGGAKGQEIVIGGHSMTKQEPEFPEAPPWLVAGTAEDEL